MSDALPVGRYFSVSFFGDVNNLSSSDCLREGSPTSKTPTPESSGSNRSKHFDDQISENERCKVLGACIARQRPKENSSFDAGASTGAAERRCHTQRRSAAESGKASLQRTGARDRTTQDCVEYDPGPSWPTEAPETGAAADGLGSDLGRRRRSCRAGRKHYKQRGRGRYIEGPRANSTEADDDRKTRRIRSDGCGSGRSLLDLHRAFVSGPRDR